MLLLDKIVSALLSGPAFARQTIGYPAIICHSLITSFTGTLL
jgi:hypothetical protein